MAYFESHAVALKLRDDSDASLFKETIIYHMPMWIPQPRSGI
jgi:hypothetical protein